MKDTISPKTVIIVDDDHDNVAVFSEYLEMYDFTVLGIGHNGKIAFELYQKHKPDIVFLDLMMPEYDGFYGLEKIKQFDPSAKIIVITADITESTKMKLMNSGISSLIYKPFELKTILVTLKKLEEVSTH